MSNRIEFYRIFRKGGQCHEIHVQWNSDFSYIQGKQKLVQKTWRDWEITAFDWGGETTFGFWFSKVKKTEHSRNRDYAVYPNFWKFLAKNFRSIWFSTQNFKALWLTVLRLKIHQQFFQKLHVPQEISVSAIFANFLIKLKAPKCYTNLHILWLSCTSTVSFFALFTTEYEAALKLKALSSANRKPDLIYIKRNSITQQMTIYFKQVPPVK